MEKDNKKLLTKVAYLYYIKGETQNEISSELNIYRTTISRMLKKARSEGIVDIQIHDFDSAIFELERQLQKQFKMRDVVVVPTVSEDTEREKEDRLAEAAAYYLKHLINGNQTVGFSWGATLAAMIGKLRGNKRTGATFVPLVGGPSHVNARYHVNAIIYDLSRYFGGECVFINAGVIQDSRLLRDGIMKSQDFQKFYEYWNRLDIAMFGIGGPLGIESHTSIWRNFLTHADQQSLVHQHAIGDCCCRFFDSEGHLLKEGLYHRTIGIDPELLKKVPHSIGVARSKEKAPSIRALMKTEMMNTLITDDETAREILDE